MFIPIEVLAQTTKMAVEVIMEDAFWKELKNRPGFDWLIEARRYLHAAEILRASAEYRRGVIMTPPLHLLAHGTELLLKANLITADPTATDVRSFGHDIWKLWNDIRSAQLRVDLLKAADEEWEAAKMSEEWQGAFNEDSGVLFKEYLKRLSELHTKEIDYALRYVRPEETEAPKPHMLGPAMYRVADQYVRAMAQARRL
ncbi:hypothetical protein [Sphingomonas sp. C3-2]|uniref:hypothetical protein n=1 Tax=Sphingomonas sp. C3-2 TaxID=3062169 RepID=UPI00294B309B|nr:hypothetical protein [Sphingomonas sp. C3-2]WOK36041.1 hypothetical protein QYC26_13675 [Sphingomonas sp. C3-2]